MKYSKTITALTKECGLKSREGLYTFVNMDGFPPKEDGKGWPIESCREFVLKHTQKDAVAANLDADIASLKKREIFERGRKLKIANDQEDKLLMPVSDHDNEVREMAAEVQKELYRLPGRCAVELAGLDPVGIEKRVKEMICEAIVSLRGK